ncbi:unnamed protein product [Rhizopus stolonifer]
MNTLSVLAKKRIFEFNVKKTELNPDCFNQSYTSLTINGQFPGPILRAVTNDIIEVVVKNSGKNNVSTSVHFHGIYQFKTNYADGIAGITQVAIPPGQKFLHRFKLKKQSGTFYYHAHVGVQDGTVQGPFIVYETEEALTNAKEENKEDKLIQEGPYKYHNERILHWSEWWHQSFHDRLNFYLQPGFSGDNGPDSILLNGRSVYDDKSPSDNCPGFTVIDVKPNSIYRLRFIGALSYRILGITIPDHNMTLIEMDSEYIKPHLIDHLELAPGQRSSVLIRTGNFTEGTMFPIATHLKWSDIGDAGYSPNGYGYIRYVNCGSHASSIAVAQKPVSLPNTTIPDVNGWVLSQLEPVIPSPVSILSTSPSRTIKLTMQRIVLPNNTTRFTNNGRLTKPWGTDTISLLDQVRKNPNYGKLSSDGFSVRHQTYPVNLGETVDIVFQSMRGSNGLCVAHPWHTHGFSHYLLAEGEGDYDHSQHGNVTTYHKPLRKDVSMQYPAPVNGTMPCGWTKVRVHMNNPGVWAVHCHITGHMVQGKIVVFEVSPTKVYIPKEK